MKKALIVLTVAVALCALRFFDNGILWLSADGKYTEYNNGHEIVFPSAPDFATKGYARLDIAGGEAEAKQGLNELFADILWEERFDGIVVFYAYSPYITDHVVVCSKRINVMVAVNDGKVAFGTPLLKGSY